MALVFTLLFYWLVDRQYVTFQLRGADIDRFSQAIWNTTRGNFLFTTIFEESLLAKHFSPYMALLSPLLLIWEDARILFLFQLVGIAAAGLILYKIVHDRHPRLAIIFLLAFYLNPPLHQIALLELRRVTLAMPFIALMLFGLYKDRRLLMLLGMAFVLLIKEDMGLIVAMVGLYLLLFKRDWRWGLPTFLIGLAWFLSMVQLVIPAIAGGDYTQLGYYSDWGDSIWEMARNVLSHPVNTLKYMFDRGSLLALWRLLLPLAIILPFLGADYLLIIAPLIALMLLSNEPAVHKLGRWYLAPVLPVLFAAVAVGIGRQPNKRARQASAALLIATLLAYALFSLAPLGGRFDSGRYQTSEQQDLIWDLIDELPGDATIVSQVAFSTPLSFRENIYVYPWHDPVEDSADYFVMGRENFSYPFDSEGINWEINNLIADPALTIVEEAGGFFIFQQGGSPLPSTSSGLIAEESIMLEKFEVAVSDNEGRYQTIDYKPLTMGSDQLLRVSLYWRALESPGENRTVSVRIVDGDGTLVAQHDMQPSSGSRPTSWWEPGWEFRDVYYLKIDNEYSLGDASLNLLLYDSATQERIPFADREEIKLWSLILQ